MNPSDARTLYQQNLSNYLSLQQHDIHSGCDSAGKFVDTSWIGDAARSLAMRSIYSFIQFDSSDGNDCSNIANKKTDSPHPPNWSDFLCMVCGTTYFPPLNPRPSPTNENSTNPEETDEQFPSCSHGSTPASFFLRTLKRGKSRKRRASRARAKQFQQDSKRMHPNVNNPNSKNNPNNAASQIMKRESLLQQQIRKKSLLLNLGDGMSRQCLVVLCGFCGSRRKWKGVDVHVKQNRRVKGGALCGDGDVQIEKKMRITLDAKSQGGEIDNNSNNDGWDDGNFISLGGLRGNMTPLRPETKKKSNARRESQPLNPLMVSEEKKRKRKRKSDQPKKSNLMDFLSSLND